MKGDDFNIIYERNYRRSFLFTKSYVHDDMVAEDIVAESLVKYWRLVSAGENEITEALLLTILKNKALNYLRHKAIHDAAIENLEEIKNRELSIRISTLEACDPKEIFSDEVNRIIHKTLKNLPEQTHRIFEMSRFENKTVKEIAVKGTWANDGTIENLGWLAVALVIFATWKPTRAIWGSYLFGIFFWAYLLIASGLTRRSQELFRMLPYIVTIIVLIIVSLRRKKEDQPPAALGLSYFREER